MREVNFSIPNANKASVGITTALYDRRALDCTSTLPLINSLNNLAYLTTSSGRIRDILTVDGGIERLVCILKGGRSKDMMEMWKWNLAFQCIVNIGVRGSEAVRTRVVEADMVPVIATILDNYHQVREKADRERAELESKRSKCPLASFGGSRSSFSRSSGRNDAHTQRSERSRRHAPPPIEIPEPRDQPDQDESTSDVTPTGPAANLSLSSPPERTSFIRHHAQRSHGTRAQFSTPSGSRQTPEQPMSAAPLPSNGSAFGLPPVRDVDRLPSMVPNLHAELSSQPQSPTTPSAPLARTGSPGASNLRRPRRPSIRHQLSISGSDDDAPVSEVPEEEDADADVDVAAATQTRPVEPHVDIQSDIVMQDIGADTDDLIDARTDALNLANPDDPADTFNIPHRTSTDGSTTGHPTLPNGQPPHQASPPTTLNAPPPTWRVPNTTLLSNFGTPTSTSAAMPREEDVLMSLQLLAYVSKYCNLRSYFQSSHLVPRLKIDADLHASSPSHEQPPSQAQLDADWDNEFVITPTTRPYNIFPLIEKFTAKPSSSHHRHSSSSSTLAPAPSSPQQTDMSYWAGVVMRNLCRKDDTRGGIRQCAFWKCGKWEEYTREFAKCRRCRRTKYCSKECQKGAWGSHRFWCVAAEEGRADEGGESAGRRHRHLSAGVRGPHHHHHQHQHQHQHQQVRGSSGGGLGG